MHLKIDLYDNKSNLLVAKNQEITDHLINDLILKGEKQSHNFVLLKDTPLIKDLDIAYSDSRYAPIFSSSVIRKQIESFFNQLKLEEPVYQELINLKGIQPYTFKHVLIIASMTISIILQLDSKQYNPTLAIHVSFTHDLGKTRISEDILNKETALTDEEYEIIQSHPAIGYILLNYYCGWEGEKYCWTAYEHHEKIDGSGYPRGIKKIDAYAQLISPIDIFDALISDRPYRRTPFTMRLAVDFLLDGVMKGQLNKKIVYALINCLRKHKAYPIDTIRISKEKRDRLPLGSVYGIRTASTWLKKD